MSALTIYDGGTGLPTEVVTVGVSAGAAAEPWHHSTDDVAVRVVHLRRPPCPQQVRLVRRVLPSRRPRCRARRTVRASRGSPDDGPGEPEPAQGRSHSGGGA